MISRAFRDLERLARLDSNKARAAKRTLSKAEKAAENSRKRLTPSSMKRAAKRARERDYLNRQLHIVDHVVSQRDACNAGNRRYRAVKRAKAVSDPYTVAHYMRYDSLPDAVDPNYSLAFSSIWKRALKERNEFRAKHRLSPTQNLWHLFERAKGSRGGFATAYAWAKAGRPDYKHYDPDVTY